MPVCVFLSVVIKCLLYRKQTRKTLRMTIVCPSLVSSVWGFDLFLHSSLSEAVVHPHLTVVHTIICSGDRWYRWLWPDRTDNVQSLEGVAWSVVSHIWLLFKLLVSLVHFQKEPMLLSLFYILHYFSASLVFAELWHCTHLLSCTGEVQTACAATWVIWFRRLMNNWSPNVVSIKAQTVFGTRHVI